MNRRDFLIAVSRSIAAPAAVAGICGFPAIVSAAALGKGKRPAASNRVTVASVGIGWQGGGSLDAFLGCNDAQVIAVCDVDANHLAAAKRKVDERYGNNDCATYHDMRELFARRDLDAVCISLPDHWHAVAAIMAAQAGLDIYGEKPLSHSLNEGRAICNAVERYGRIWQTGSWQRSVANFHHICELVRNGRIGKVRHIEVGIGGGHADFDKTGDQIDPRPAPPELDYEMWLGPAPWSPFAPAKHHKSWRWHLDYGGGMLLDWVGHHVDIAHWGMGYDYAGPVSVEGVGEFPSGLWNAPTKHNLHLTYADGVTMQVCDELDGGTRWIGDDGWLHVNRGFSDASSKALLKDEVGPEEIRLTRSTDHYQNFVDCVKSRQTTITPCQIAHRSASIGHLGLISMKLGRPLKWNPEAERFIDDPDADRLLGHPMRSPWGLPA